MEPKEKKQRITFGTGLLMLITAGIFDLLDLIPFLNIVITVAATSTFLFWFVMKGVSIVNPKRIVTTAVASIAQVFPVVSWIPAWIAYVIIVWVMTTFEDKTGIKLAPGLGGGSVAGIVGEAAKKTAGGAA